MNSLRLAMISERPRVRFQKFSFLIFNIDIYKSKFFIFIYKEWRYFEATVLLETTNSLGRCASLFSVGDIRKHPLHLQVLPEIETLSHHPNQFLLHTI